MSGRRGRIRHAIFSVLSGATLGVVLWRSHQPAWLIIIAAMIHAVASWEFLRRWQL